MADEACGGGLAVGASVVAFSVVASLALRRTGRRYAGTRVFARCRRRLGGDVDLVLERSTAAVIALRGLGGDGEAFFHVGAAMAAYELAPRA